MSIRIVGYTADRRRITVDEGPQVGRTLGRRTGGRPVMGGQLVTGAPGATEKQRLAQRACMRRKRAES